MLLELARGEVKDGDSHCAGAALDADALRASLTDLVARHESLRTLFTAPDGKPQQVVVPADQADIGWETIDAAGWPAARLDEAVSAAARRTAKPVKSA